MRVLPGRLISVRSVGVFVDILGGVFDRDTRGLANLNGGLANGFAGFRHFL